MSTVIQVEVAEPAPPAEAAEIPLDRLYRLRIDQYLAMIDAAILTTEDKAELIEGVLVEKMGKNQPHVDAHGFVLDVLIRSLPPGWYVSIQDPITCRELDSEPEPDAKVVRGSRRGNEGRRIGPADVGLVIEVSDSSLAYDRGIKKRLYAQALIPTYWIVNIPDRRLEVYTEPAGPDYGRRVDLGPDERIALILDGVEIAQVTVADLLPGS